MDNAKPTFLKMHGTGNDFVVLDLRHSDLRVNNSLARTLADRHVGIGCDQVISIEPSNLGDAFMRVHNPDGGEAQACGNGTRCVASLLFSESGKTRVFIETRAGILTSRMAGGPNIEVDMGPAYTEWQKIPLAYEMDTLHLDLTINPHQGSILTNPCAVGLGNPHAVFFVEDLNAIDLTSIGPSLENHPLFPEKANIGFVQVLSDNVLRLRVWERGAGLTLACGSGACAALVAANRRGKCGRRAKIMLDGGTLAIRWREEDSHVLMTGPVATTFSGVVDESLIKLSKFPQQQIKPNP